MSVPSALVVTVVILALAAVPAWTFVSRRDRDWLNDLKGAGLFVALAVTSLAAVAGLLGTTKPDAYDSTAAYLFNSWFSFLAGAGLYAGFTLLATRRPR